MFGSLMTMACITIANMKKRVLLHHLILIEVCIPPAPTSTSPCSPGLGSGSVRVSLFGAIAVLLLLARDIPQTLQTIYRNFSRVEADIQTSLYSASFKEHSSFPKPLITAGMSRRVPFSSTSVGVYTMSSLG